MLHIIFDPTQTVNKNSIYQSHIFCLCSDVSTAKKRSKSYKIFISCSFQQIVCRGQACEMFPWMSGYKFVVQVMSIQCFNAVALLSLRYVQGSNVVEQTLFDANYPFFLLTLVLVKDTSEMIIKYQLNILSSYHQLYRDSNIRHFSFI